MVLTFLQVRIFDSNCLIQVGWFDNPHSRESNYQKDVRSGLDLRLPNEFGA